MDEPRRSPCPEACALEVVGDKWSLLIIRDLLCGKSQFKEFLASPERIATNILANRLHRLVEEGLVERSPSPQHPARETYRLNAKGRTLGPVLKEVARWGLDNIEGTAVLLQPKF